MPLPFILGGVAAATAAKLVGAAIKKSRESEDNYYYYIKNERSMYFKEMVEKRFLFINYKKPQWVSNYNDAEGFNDEEEANDCIQQNKFRGVAIIAKSV